MKTFGNAFLVALVAAHSLSAQAANRKADKGSDNHHGLTRIKPYQRFDTRPWIQPLAIGVSF